MSKLNRGYLIIQHNFVFDIPVLFMYVKDQFINNKCHFKYLYCLF
jgi:hypothetical protein